MNYVARRKSFKGCGGVYVIENTINGRFYVGSTTNFSRRFRQHKHLLLGEEHPNPILQNSFDKYGRGAFQFRVLVVCDDEALQDTEQRFLDAWAALPESYNISLCVEASRRGSTMPAHVKEILLKANLGRSQCETQKSRKRSSRALSGPEKANEYKGVTYNKSRGKFKSQIQYKGQRRQRRFDTAEEAAAQYNEWATELYGEGNCYLNDVDVAVPEKVSRLESYRQRARMSRMRGPLTGEYKGVSWCSTNKKYRAQLNGEHIGWYESSEKAAEAYDDEARKKWGDNCYLNFEVA